MPPDDDAATGDRLLKAITAQEKALEHIISARRQQGKREITPEHQRVLGEIHEALGELRRLHLLKRGERPFDAEALDRSLVEMVEGREVSALSIPASWEYALGLQRLLLTVGDRHYIKAQLESEWKKEIATEAPYRGRWSAYFDRKLLEDLIAEYKKAEGVTEDGNAHRQAVEYLTYLSVTRNSIGRSLAMNSNTRTLYLDRLTNVLAGLLLLLLVIIYVASFKDQFVFFGVLQELGKGGQANLGQFRLNPGHPDFRHALLAGALGAMGSLISGFYTLRDKVKYLHDLRSFRAAMWAQPFVGATAGVIVFLAIRSGLIGLTVRGDLDQWPAYGLYGFIAGFSEPFFLGIVSRVASTADKQKPGEGGEAPPVKSPPAPENPARPVTSPPLTSPPDVTSPPDDDVITSPPEDDVITSP